MNSTLEYFVTRYFIDLNQPSPIRINMTREWGLLRALYRMNFKVGVEVGVYEGKFSARICRHNPQMKMYCVDPWENYPEYEDYHLLNLPLKYEVAKENLAPYKNAEIIKDYSVNAAKRFEDESIDFIYIDAAHDFFHVTQDLKVWTPKMKKGAIISGHDYGNRKHYGVVKAVNRWVRIHKIHPLFIIDRNTTKSWMFIKE